MFRLETDYPREMRDAEVRQYVQAKLSQSPVISDNLTAGLSIDEVADRVVEKAAGNFLVASYMPSMLESLGKITVEALERLPSGLTATYRRFLDRICPDEQRWADSFRPVLGPLAVAQKPLCDDELARIAGVPEDELRTRLASVAQFLTTDKNGASREIYHRSFADFLLDRNESATFWCSPSAQHQRIVDHAYRLASERGISLDWRGASDYVIDHLFHHLVRISGRAACARIEEVLESEFLRTKSHRRDFGEALGDLRLALDFVATMPGQLRMLLTIAWSYVAWRDRLSQTVAPPLLPIHVKLGNVALARKLAATLDETSDEFGNEASSARRSFVKALAEVGQVWAAVEAAATFEPNERGWLLDEIVGIAAVTTPEVARAVLERQGLASNNLSATTCAALAGHAEHLEFALARAGTPSAKAAVAVAVATHSPKRAIEIAWALSSMY
jgi:hypothetical protein